jgi:hypothetical protein
MSDSSKQETEYERTYRRGYLDGWVTAHDAVIDGATHDDLWHHWRTELTTWETTNLEQLEFPPPLRIDPAPIPSDN